MRHKLLFPLQGWRNYGYLQAPIFRFWTSIQLKPLIYVFIHSLASDTCLVSFSSRSGVVLTIVKGKVAQSCLTLSDPVDHTVHGILQARILEWVAFSFSRRSSQPRDQTQVSRIAGRFFTSWATREVSREATGEPLTVGRCGSSSMDDAARTVQSESNELLATFVMPKLLGVILWKR